MENIKRQLNARHIRFLALGSAIGTGLFYGSATAAQLAGPAVILAYLIGGAAVYMVMRALGEMAVHQPISGSFGHYAGQYIHPLAGFLTSWTYVFEVIIVSLADVTAFGIYMAYWLPDVPQWIWVLSIVIIIFALNLCNARIFGEMEFVLSLIKILAIIGMIIGGAIILMIGANIYSHPLTIRNLWQYGGFFPHGMVGFVASFAVVMFAYGGIEVIGITAGEVKNPEQAIPKAINAIPLRILLFYILTMTILMSLFPWSHIGSTSSPFVQIFVSLGIPFAATILNIVVISAVISAVNSNIFCVSRMLHGMAQQGQAPRCFSNLSRYGVPWTTISAMTVALLIGAFLNYLIPKNVFLLIASIATFATVWVWLMILIAQFGMRQRLSKDVIAKLKFPVPLWPFGQIIATIFMCFIMAILGYFETTRIALVTGTIWITSLSLLFFLLRKNILKKQMPHLTSHSAKLN